MEIGVIGINTYARKLCRHWIRKGHKILFADLNLYSENDANVEGLGPKVVPALPDRVVREAEIIVIAVAAAKLKSTLALLDIQQKIVVDFVIEDRENDFESSFDLIQSTLTQAKVVKVTPVYPYHLLNAFEETDTLYSYSQDHLAQRMIHWSIDGSGYTMHGLDYNRLAKKPKSI